MINVLTSLRNKKWLWIEIIRLIVYFIKSFEEGALFLSVLDVIIFLTEAAISQTCSQDGFPFFHF